MGENRKIKLTKRAVEDALTELLLEKPLSKITVTKLCDYANINRSTFYAHYKDIIDVMDEMEENVLKQLAIIDKKQSRKENTRRLKEYLNYIMLHRNTFIVLIDNGRIENEVFNISMSVYEQEQGGFHGAKSLHELIVRYSCSGTYHIIYDWLTSKTNYTSSEVAELIMDLSEGMSKVEEANMEKIKML